MEYDTVLLIPLLLLGQTFVSPLQVRVPCINFQENTLSYTCHNLKAKNFIL